MSEREAPGANDQSFAVTLVHGCRAFGRTEIASSVPAGHHLSRARIRHLAQSDRVAVCDGTCVLGLAAYRKVDSDVRVVHEFLLNRRLDARSRDSVAHLLLKTLEMLAYDDQVHCVMVLLGPEVPLTPFVQHAYATLATDANGAWLQKRLDAPRWIGVTTHHVH
jgi:hypothetical protein